jgi:hypothetical protein
MSNVSSYIYLFRDSLKHRYFKNVNLWHFYQYCMMKASYKKHAVMVGNQSVEIERGEFVFGRKVAAEESGLTENEIRTCLKILEKDKKVTIKTTNKFSIISIMKFDSWQIGSREDNQQVNQQTTNKPPTTYHIQEGKEGKGKKKNITPSSPDAIRLAEKLADYILENNPSGAIHLQNGKRVATVTAWSSVIDKLNRLDKQEWSDIEKVIDWCQKDVFWKINILSANKLREKYPQLSVKMNLAKPAQISAKIIPQESAEDRYRKMGLIA